MPARVGGRNFPSEVRNLAQLEGNFHVQFTDGKCLILYFRSVMAWTFLYAASHQVFVPGWTVVGFLSHTKTFHDVFVVFTTPTMAPITTFMVEYGTC